MTICPCCGFRFEGDLQKGCEGCGARAVGEPLPKPDHELPAYGRPLLLVACGALMIAGFLAQTVAALARSVPLSFGFWSWVAAGETAAWRLKWISIPVAILVLWGGKSIYRSMMQQPARFVGIKMARRGLAASAFVCLLIATLIGVTVPDRLRQRRFSIEATQNAYSHTLARALLEYQAIHETLPGDLAHLRDLPDEDGSIARALDALGSPDLSDYQDYTTSTQVAEVPKGKQTTLRGAALRNAASVTREDPPGGGLIESYELRIPGEDKILGTDDDLFIRDGVIYTVSEMKDIPSLTKAPLRARKR